MVALIVLAALAGIAFLPQQLPTMQATTVRGIVAVCLVTLVYVVRGFRAHRQTRRDQEHAERERQKAATQEQQRQQLAAQAAARQRQEAARQAAMQQWAARLAQLEAAVGQAFAEYAVRAEFTGQGDPTALRRAFAAQVLAGNVADIGLLRASERPEIRAIIAASAAWPPLPAALS